MGLEEKCLECENCIRVYNDSIGMREVDEKDAELIHSDPEKFGVRRDLYCADVRCKTFKELTGYKSSAYDFIKKVYYGIKFW